MFVVDQHNPWLETDKSQRAQSAILTIYKARRRAEAAADTIPLLSDRLNVFCEDLAIIEKAYRADASAFRRSRALTTVHLPAIMEVIEQLDANTASHNDDRYKALAEQIGACLVAATQARAALEDSSYSSAEITAAVLAKQINADISVDASEPEAEASFLGGWVKSGRAIAQSSARAVTSPIAALATDISERAVAGQNLATGYISALYEDTLDTLTSPVTTRLRAARHAFEGASINAILGGCLLAIVFPPAAPLALGLAALEAPDLYSDKMRSQSEQIDKDRQMRRAARSESTAKQIARLKGVSPIVRMETPYLHVSIDLAAGQADGVVLAGRHSGRLLSDLHEQNIASLIKFAPDDETKKILESWNARRAA